MSQLRRFIELKRYLLIKCSAEGYVKIETASGSKPQWGNHMESEQPHDEKTSTENEKGDFKLNVHHSNDEVPYDPSVDDFAREAPAEDPKSQPSVENLEVVEASESYL